MSENARILFNITTISKYYKEPLHFTAFYSVISMILNGQHDYFKKAQPAIHGLMSSPGRKLLMV